MASRVRHTPAAGPAVEREAGALRAVAEVPVPEPDYDSIAHRLAELDAGACTDPYCNCKPFAVPA